MHDEHTPVSAPPTDTPTLLYTKLGTGKYPIEQQLIDAVQLALTQNLPHTTDHTPTSAQLTHKEALPVEQGKADTRSEVEPCCCVQ
jgi:hypothetical protein